MKETKQRIKDLLSKMTLEEKVGQLNGLALNKPYEELAEATRKGEMGGLVAAFSAFAGHESKQSEYDSCMELQRIAIEESRLGIPLILGRDVIHGHRTVFPIPLAQAASWDEEAVAGACKIAAQEAMSDGIHWTYTPMLDIARDPRWGRIIEGFGEDPFLCGQMAKASVKGYQNQNLAACAKHYVGYGASEGGRDYDSTEITDYTLRNIYLPSFKAAVKEGVHTVMSSFNDIGGEPVTASRRLLTDILKDEYGFKGFVVGDWDVVGQLLIQGVAKDGKDAARIALNAGVDMDNVSELYIKYLPELIAEGKVPMSRLDDAVRRILWIKFELGLFENPYGKKAEKGNTSPLPLSRDYARKIAASSMVLLKNENNLLPLSKEKTNIAVIGPYATERRAHLGAWTLDGRAQDVVTVLEGIQKAAPDANIITSQSDLFDDVYAAARKADYVVVVLGESHERTGEARSVADISLSPDQKKLLEEVSRFNQNIVVVICAGRPVALEIPSVHAKAMLYAWHSGIEAGNAVADILFGDVNPSAKLPVTFPRCTGQIPIYYNHKAASRRIDEYYNDYEFANYQDSPGSPMYPFGYGLQYTAYKYEKIRTSKKEIKAGESLQVSIDVANISSRQGVETVQCYLRAHHASLARPMRELKAFRRVSLEAGETKTVIFDLGLQEMGFYNAQGAFVLEPGDFTVLVGGNCQEAQAAMFAVI